MSKIQWTNETWNPIAGCSKISPGCGHCYAVKDAHRLAGNPHAGIAAKYAGTTTGDGKNWTGRVNFDEGALTLPLRWKKPHMVFVNSMSDLFHENVSDEWIDRIFAVMALARWHTFQVLTKRPERMRDYFLNRKKPGVAPTFYHVAYRVSELTTTLDGRNPSGFYLTEDNWPLPNVWLGVSVENQETANERIPLLLQTPAAVRWISAEPLLGPINLHRIKDPKPIGVDPGLTFDSLSRKGGIAFKNGVGLDWVVPGLESGLQARPGNLLWIRGLVDQCDAARVPCFVKQLGAWPYEHWPSNQRPLTVKVGGKKVYPFLDLKDRKGGDINEFPEDLRVRQFPESKPVESV